MKKLFLFIAVFMLASIGAAQENKQLENLLFSFRTIDGGYIAVCSDGNHFYTGRWLSDHITRYDMDGTNPVTFSVDGVSEIRNMTCDGTYFYAVNLTMNIYKLDLVSGTLVDIIPVTCEGIYYGIYHISFDPALDGGNGGFWLGGSIDLCAVSMNGSELIASIPGVPEGISGSAYDHYSDPENPVLWLNTQIFGGFAIIRQFDINTLSMNSFEYNIGDYHPECYGYAAGGMDSYLDENQKFCLAVDVQMSPNMILVFELVDMMDPDVPAPVNNLTVTPDPNGALNAVLNWTNPTLTYGGSTLTELTAVKIYEGNNLIHTVSDPTIGGTDAYTATVNASGIYTFKVVSENSVGIGGVTSIVSEWIGHDVPAAPQNPELEVTYNGDDSWTTSVSWSAPVAGLNGGYFTSNNLVYNVYRMPDNVIVSESQTEVTFSETITTLGTYYYKIQALNHIGAGGASATSEYTFCLPVSSFPSIESFSSTSFPPVCWNVFTIEGTVPWNLSTYFNFSPPYAASVFAYDPGDRDTWLVTREIAVPATGNYVLEFQSRIDMAMFYGSSEVWVSTESPDPNSNTYVMVKQLVDGVDFGSVADWRQLTVPLGDFLGENIYIAFRYTGTGPMAHSWFIDDVTFKDLPNVDLEASKLFGALTPMVDEPFLYKAIVKNLGGTPVTDYTVKLIDENDNVLAVNSDNEPLAVGESLMITFNWTPETADNFVLYAIVEAEDDSNPDNDVSLPLSITVQPADNVFNGVIGNGVTPEFVTPFCFILKYAMAQTIYYNHEIIGRGGAISQIKYFNNFSETRVESVQVWMANTTWNSLEQWLPQDEFALVFEGDVEFPAGENEIIITLDELFVYTGDNLVVMTKPMFENVLSPGMKAFYITETPDFQNRSRVFLDNFSGFNWTQPGTPAFLHPNTVLTIIQQEFGSVSGVVTTNGTTPLAGALVEVVGTSHKRTTDANGIYSFDFLIPENYQLKASKHGYFEATSDVISVVADENSVVDFIVAPIPTFTVSGKVTGNNAPGGLENVQITISGYDHYSATTNATGDYSITGVYNGYEYTVNAELQDYQYYTSTVEVNGNHVTHNIVLHENAYPVVKLFVELVENDAVVSWDMPNSGTSVNFRYDSGQFVGEVGWSNGTNLSIIGAVHRGMEAELTNISWFSSPAVIQQEYDLWILGLDENEMPDRNKVIFTAQHVTNTPAEWCTYQFSETIYTLDGFFMGVSPSNGGFTSIGVAAPNANYPFTPNTNLSSFNPEDGWHCFSEDNFPLNAMIRAEGVMFGKSAGVVSSPKSLTNYKVYRLLEGQQNNESLWIELAGNLSETHFTDTEWSSLANGEYRYAVKAEYTNGVFSAAKFTKILERDVEEFLPPTNLTIEETGNMGERRFSWSAPDNVAEYVIYLDNIEKATTLDLSFLFTELANGNHIAGVKAVYTAGASEIVTIDFLVNDIGITTNTLHNITLYPNPFTNEIFISSEYSVVSIEIMNVAGQIVGAYGNTPNTPTYGNTPTFNGKSIKTDKLAKGVYFVVIEMENGEKGVYKVVKE